MRSILRFLRFALTPGNLPVTLLVDAGLSAPGVWKLVQGHYQLAGLLFAIAAAVLCAIGGIRLQRRLDKQPDLALSVDPSRTPIVQVPIVNWPGGATGDLWHLLAAADGAVARNAVATLLEVQMRVGKGFRRHPRWMHSYALSWAGPDSSQQMQLHPDDPQLVDLGFTIAGGNLFYLGTADATPGGQLLGIGPGDYRLKIALRADNAEHKAVVRWFGLRYDGSSAEVSEAGEG